MFYMALTKVQKKKIYIYILFSIFILVSENKLSLCKNHSRTRFIRLFPKASGKRNWGLGREKPWDQPVFIGDFYSLRLKFGNVKFSTFFVIQYLYK